LLPIPVMRAPIAFRAWQSPCTCRLRGGVEQAAYAPRRSRPPSGGLGPVTLASSRNTSANGSGRELKGGSTRRRARLSLGPGRLMALSRRTTPFSPPLPSPSFLIRRVTTAVKRRSRCGVVAGGGDLVAARPASARRAPPRETRRGEQERLPGSRRPAPLRGATREGRRHRPCRLILLTIDTDAERADELDQGAHVSGCGHVVDTDASGREERSRQERQRLVLVAARGDLATDGCPPRSRSDRQRASSWAASNVRQYGRYWPADVSQSHGLLTFPSPPRVGGPEMP
jgi:hypothetical protein